MILPRLSIWTFLCFVDLETENFLQSARLQEKSPSSGGLDFSRTEAWRSRRCHLNLDEQTVTGCRLQVQLTGPNRALHLSAADTAACAAAAGQWSAALVTLLAEYKRSIYFPECVVLFGIQARCLL